jgi:hypothetical protein
MHKSREELPMTKDDYIDGLMEERRLLFEACREYREKIDQLEYDLAKAKVDRVTPVLYKRCNPNDKL